MCTACGGDGKVLDSTLPGKELLAVSLDKCIVIPTLKTACAFLCNGIAVEIGDNVSVNRCGIGGTVSHPFGIIGNVCKIFIVVFGT